jgi:hypothetical protein
MRNFCSFTFLLVILIIGTNSIKINPIIDKTPPIFPNYFTTNWTIYLLNSTAQIPDDGSSISKANSKGSGSSYYDWNNRRMIEVYNDFCFPLFEYPWKDFEFPCKFLNSDEKVYLIMPSQKLHPPCCLYSDNFHPPYPDFARRSKLSYRKSLKLTNGKMTDFWGLDAVVDGEIQPFYFGWTREKLDGYRIPGEFTMLGVEPNNYSVQIYKDFKIEKPNESIFILPKICDNAPKCIWHSKQKPNHY